MTMDPAAPAPEAAPHTQRRVVKRYSNRKLYDTKESRYVTLLQIADIIRTGEDVQIIDNSTKEDKTDVTLALIISEELKARPRGIPLSTLKLLIRHRGEKLLSQIRESPIGRLMPKDSNQDTELPVENADTATSALEPDSTPVDDPHAGDVPSDGEASKAAATGRGFFANLQSWQAAIDERIRAVLPNFSAFRDLEAEVRQLAARVESLEAHVQRFASPSPAEEVAVPATEEPSVADAGGAPVTEIPSQESTPAGE